MYNIIDIHIHIYKDFIYIAIGDGTRFMCLYVNFILFHKLFDQHNSSVNLQRSLFQCNLYRKRTLRKPNL